MRIKAAKSDIPAFRQTYHPHRSFRPLFAPLAYPLSPLRTMRFTTIATVLVASACAAFALPAEADAAVLVPRREPGDFELRVFRTTSYSDLDYKVYRKAGTYTFNFDARSWLYYDAGCCVRYIIHPV
jgi:hypothetical protein